MKINIIHPKTLVFFSFITIQNLHERILEPLADIEMIPIIHNPLLPFSTVHCTAAMEATPLSKMDVAVELNSRIFIFHLQREVLSAVSTNWK